MTKHAFSRLVSQGILVLGLPLLVAISGCGGGSGNAINISRFAGNLTGSAVTLSGPDTGATITLAVTIDSAGVISFVSTVPGSPQGQISGTISPDGSFVATRAATSTSDAITITGRVTGTGTGETITGTFTDTTNGDSGTFSISTGQGGAFAGAFGGSAHVASGPGAGTDIPLAIVVSSTGALTVTIVGAPSAPITGKVNMDGLFTATRAASTGVDAIAMAGRFTGTGSSESATGTFTDYTTLAAGTLVF